MSATTSFAQPSGWPDGPTYLREPVYSPQLTAGELEQIRSSWAAFDDATRARVSISSEARKKVPYMPVNIRAITDPRHPAHGQSGLFASRAIPPDTLIIDYIGYVHNVADTDKESDYDISLDRDAGLAVDAAKMGNEARFINDYRGVCTDGPNAEFRDHWVRLNATGPDHASGSGSGSISSRPGALAPIWEKRIAVFALSPGKVKSAKRARGIREGEEILVSYGKGFWSNRSKSEDYPEPLVTS